jgi:hypothetical protein
MQLGPQKTAQVVYKRFSNQWYVHRIRSKALKKQLNSSWPALQKKYGLGSFKEFFSQLNKKSYAFASDYLRHIPFDKKTYCKRADDYCKKEFNLLGSGSRAFDDIPWYQDFRLGQESADTFFPAFFSKDIIVSLGKTKELEKDIKIPWELSRFQHLFVLGYSYQQTGNQTYANTFVEHITDWLEKNPVLIGPNWVCPMDVGLRAINWIWAFYFFKDCIAISPDFWEHFVCSLYDHAHYLENNWEMYDSRTSNHYLSDLVGYFYCCYFFSVLPDFEKKAAWCHQEILREFEKQIFAEGTDYEGSTYYHKLVTELFYHWYTLAVHGFGNTIEASFLQKLQKMFNFLWWCMPHKGALISVGDNDSGKVLDPSINPSLLNVMTGDQSYGIKHYSDFGISLLKTKELHLSLRHHSYAKRQPSGHFHNDVGSVTLNYKGIDIFVDSGSYVYTPSIFWRNHFRSVTAHNTFFIEGHEPVLLDDRLFTLDLPENRCELNDDSSILSTAHDLYARFGLRAQRTLAVSKDYASCTMTDQWIGKPKHELLSVWNFTLGPTLNIQMLINGILLSYNKKSLVRIETDLPCEIVEAYISYEYGTKLKTQALRMKKQIDEIPVNIRCTFL